MRRITRHRRGAALLLALAALSLLSVVGVGMLRRASTLSLQSRASVQAVQARIVVDSLDRSLLEWAAGTQVKPKPKAGSSTRQDADVDPSGWRSVLNQTVDDLQITIDAIDLSGRLPAWAMNLPDGDAMDPAIHESVRLATEGSSWPTGAANLNAMPLVLEQLVQADPRGEQVAVFPPCGDAAMAAQPHTVCEWLTTHDAKGVNIRTAPLELLSSVLNGGGVDRALATSIVDLRRRNLPIPDEMVALASASRQQILGTSAVSAPSKGVGSNPMHPPRVPLTGSSDGFGFLISVGSGTHPGSMRRGPVFRWWVVVQYGPPPKPATVRSTSAAQGSLSAAIWYIAEHRRIDG